MLPRYLGSCSTAFSRTTFFSVGPPPVGNGDLLRFWKYLGPGHLQKFRARAKNRKTQFAGARGPGTEKKVTTLSGMVVRNFFTVYVLTDRTPTGGETRNRHLEKSRARAENGKSKFPAAEGLETKEKLLTRYLGWLSPTFLHFTFWPTGPPRAGNCKIRLF